MGRPGSPSPGQPPPRQAEVVAIGSELLLGQIVDTNSAVIARHFAGMGLNLFYKTTVGDNLGRVTEVLRQALSRSDVVVTTGGIGPTADDITREAVAAATERALVFSEHLMRQIETFFASRGFRLSPSHPRQAYLPGGGGPLQQPAGAAPAPPPPPGPPPGPPRGATRRRRPSPSRRRARSARARPGPSSTRPCRPGPKTRSASTSRRSAAFPC